MNKRQTKQIAAHMWARDGKPERVAGDPTSAYRGLYDDWAQRVSDSLNMLGYVCVKRPTKRAKATGSAA